MRNKGARLGFIIVAVGILVGISPLLAAEIAALLGSDAGMTIQWFALLTIPIGIAGVIAGIIVAVTSAFKQPANELSELHGIAGSPAKPTPELAGRVKRFYLFFAILLTTSSAAMALLSVGAGSFDPVGIIIPPAVGWWLYNMSRRVENGTSLLRLVSTQQIVAIVGCVAGPLALLSNVGNLTFVGDPGMDSGWLISTVINGAVISGVSIASLVFARRVVATYRAQSSSN